MSSAYLPRLVDPFIDELLAAFPAVLVVGPRACGKTTTAARHARTILRLDREAEAAAVSYYVLDQDKLPWYIDLLNINLNNSDLALARERIEQYRTVFSSDGRRMTENLDTQPVSGSIGA